MDVTLRIVESRNTSKRVAAKKQAGNLPTITYPCVTSQTRSESHLNIVPTITSPFSFRHCISSGVA